MEDYVTVYTKDYLPTPNKYPAVKLPLLRRSCIEDSFKEFLRLDSFKKELKTDEEHFTAYLKNEFEKAHPNLAKKYFETELDDVDVGTRLTDLKRTIYDVDYCGEYKEKQPSKYKTTLPNDTELPSTTYKSAYRVPTMLNNAALNRVPKIVQIPTLGNDKNIQKVLGVTTGVSEYSGVIGELGSKIIDDQIYGKIC